MSEPQKAKTDAADTKTATALPGTLESDPAPLAVDDNVRLPGPQPFLLLIGDPCMIWYLTGSHRLMTKVMKRA
jgi:hypothetical protein